MASKGMVVYLLTGFSLAVVSVYFVNNYSQTGSAEPSLLLFSNSSNVLVSTLEVGEKLWPVSFVVYAFMDMDFDCAVHFRNS